MARMQSLTEQPSDQPVVTLDGLPKGVDPNRVLLHLKAETRGWIRGDSVLAPG
ncbi:MAG: hypothetical protein JWM80_5567 [Cyanobacteria bacterium RYN_339]|nr:hypothetical protein [Cyanobacteria bacterium RYN_339]